MVFSMNDANGDWRINTTAASLQAWKECLATYAPMTPSGLRSGAGPAAFGFAHAVGDRLVLSLDRSAPVSVRMLGVDGREDRHREFGVLSAGSHELQWGDWHSGLALVRAGDRTQVVARP